MFFRWTPISKSNGQNTIALRPRFSKDSPKIQVRTKMGGDVVVWKDIGGFARNENPTKGK
jgi:hypothetical protein